MKRLVMAIVGLMLMGSVAVSDDAGSDCTLYQVLFDDGYYHDFCMYPWNPYCIYGIYDPIMICNYGSGPEVTQTNGSISQSFVTPPPNPSPSLAALADMLESGEPSGVPDTGYEPGTDAMGPY